MARQSLQEELNAYLHYGEDKAREMMAKTYQQEVVLHVGDWISSMFKSWNSQAPENAKDTFDLRKGRQNIENSEYVELADIFHEGGKITIDTLHKSLKRLRQPGKSVAWQETHLQTFKDIAPDGGSMLVIYLLSPKDFNWESPQFSGALGRAKKKGLEAINKKLKDKKKRQLKGGTTGAGGDLWGHHGGITGADPDSTYGLAGVQRGADSVSKNYDETTFEPVINDKNELESYSDVFWKRVQDSVDVKAMWEAKQHSRRPTAALTADFNDTHKMRIVLGHKGLKPIKGGADKLSSGVGASGWTPLGAQLDKILDDIRKEVEDHIIQKMGEDAPDMKGSETPRTKVRKLAAETVVLKLGAGLKGSKKSKNVKVTTKVDPIKKAGKKRTKLTANSKKKSKSPVNSSKGTRVPVKTKKLRGKSRGVSQASTSPIGLVALLNKSLAKEVMKNMGPYPRRLENRTGRFANSAEVTNVAPYPNSVEIQYTYQKDPYGVFEPENGNAMSSWGRDPKRIIGGTIRELAQSIMGTKYGLVRTKRV